MKYPRLVYTLSYKKIDDFHFIVTDEVSGNEQTISGSERLFMKQLDGYTDPYKIAPENWTIEDIDVFLDFLKENHFTGSRIRKNGFLSFTLSLIKITPTLKKRMACLILNCILLISFLPVFVTGCVLFVKNLSFVDTYFNYSYMAAGIVFGTLVGLIFHEIGHVICALSYGKSKVYEAGLVIGIFLGAYVAMNTERIKEKRRKIQIMAGGIEVNLLIAGLSFILYAFIPELSSFFAGAAWPNAILAAINSILIVSLDGCGIMDELMDSESVFFTALDFITNRDTREKMLCQGITGVVKIIAYVISSLFQIAYPALLIINIYSIMEVLFE